jgi:hypothetical protein
MSKPHGFEIQDKETGEKTAYTRTLLMETGHDEMGRPLYRMCQEDETIDLETPPGAPPKQFVIGYMTDDAKEAMSDYKD